jgi:hypothetical protein
VTQIRVNDIRPYYHATFNEHFRARVLRVTRREVAILLLDAPEFIQTVRVLTPRQAQDCLGRKESAK